MEPESVKLGDRIELIEMHNDPDPIEPGSKGIVRRVTDGPLGQVLIHWESGRSLALIPGVDRFKVIDPAPRPAQPHEPQPIIVPTGVYLAILAVQASGETNMFDEPMVAKLAKKMGFHEGAFWLSDPANRRAYAEGIFRGFKPEDDGGRK